MTKRLQPNETDIIMETYVQVFCYGYEAQLALRHPDHWRSRSVARIFEEACRNTRDRQFPRHCHKSDRTWKSGTSMSPSSSRMKAIKQLPCRYAVLFNIVPLRNRRNNAADPQSLECFTSRPTNSIGLFSTKQWNGYKRLWFVSVNRKI